MASRETESDATWEELLGSKNWEGLLEPLNLDLRNLILRSGDFCQATYDAFNNDQNSKYCGSSRYGKRSFFHKVMLPNASLYQVSCFLYGTARVTVPEALLLHSRSRHSWDRESNWIGYVAVTSDQASSALGRREVYVVWRGTTRDYEWIDVFGAELQSAKRLLRPSDQLSSNSDKATDSSSDSDDDEGMPKVMWGWQTIYTSDNPKSEFVKLSARQQLLQHIKDLRNKYRGEKLSIVLTGHSLGASLAVLSGFDLSESGVSSDIPVSAIVFGCPQVGNKAFKERMDGLGNVKVLHVRNTIDLIPHYPGSLLGYARVGTEELVIDTRKSTSLKESKNPSDWHNLQAMLHVVAGWNGKEGEFELKVKRSVPLVNKSCEFLKEELLIPGSWWVEKNKGMVLDEDTGEWSPLPPSDEDVPRPEF